MYTLVVERGGIKMKLSKDQTPWSGDFPDGTPDGRPTSGASPTVLARGRFAGEATPMSMFVTFPQSDADVPSVFTAIQEQLGMKLKPAKAPFEVLVIDHIERPSAN